MSNPISLNPHLYTARLYLAPQLPEHAAVMMQVLGDARVHTFVPSEPPKDKASLQERFARLSTRMSPSSQEYWRNWVVFYGKEAIGTVQATVVPDERRADVAYMFHSHFWGFGYAVEAVQRMLEHLSDDLEIDQFGANIDTRNRASPKLVERLGFVQTAKIEGADIFKGSVSDEYRYELDIRREPL